MAKQSRESLMRSFKQGQMPAQNAFNDLIESMLNIVDQQFDKTEADGLKVGQIKQGRLISFYRDINQKSAIWSVSMNAGENGLVFGTGGVDDNSADALQNGAYCKAMELRPAPGLAVAPGAGDALPPANQFELELQGRMMADGRIGRAVRGVPADGAWHDLTGPLTGCHAFEVMAGTGKQGTGHYALMHAIALNTFHRGKEHITYHQAHFGSKCTRMTLRWTKEKGPAGHAYRLQIRTGCPLEPAGTAAKHRTSIQVYLTQLWFDPAMDECKPESQEGGN